MKSILIIIICFSTSIETDIIAMKLTPAEGSPFILWNKILPFIWRVTVHLELTSNIFSFQLAASFQK